MDIEIKGMNELQRNIDRLAKRLSYKIVGNILLEGARTVVSIAKMKVKKVSGTLRDAIIAKLLPEKGGYSPTAIATVDRRKAPHGHLVEYGSVPRYHKSGKYVGIMPKKPFLRPAWDETKFSVLTKVLNDLKNLVEGG